MQRFTRRLFSFLALAPLLSLAPLVATSACTKNGGFLSAFSSGSQTKDPLAAGIEAATDPAKAPKLDKAQVGEQLKGLVVTPGVPADSGKDKPAAPGDGLVCALETPTADETRLVDGQIVVRYEATTDACIRDWYKAEPIVLTSGVGFAAFTYTLACPGQDAAAIIDVKSLKASKFYRHQSFDFGGAAEAKCLAKSGGKAAYRLSTTKTQAIEGKDRTDPSRTSKLDSKTTFEVSAADRTPCHVAQDAVGVVTISDCVYRSTMRVDGQYSARPAEAFEAVVVAAAHDLRAKPGERFYSAGTMDLTLNNWHGTATFKNGAEAPVAELSDGRQVLRFRLNGEFTDELK